MPHIEVPCPEEYLAEVTSGLMRIQLGMGGWNDDTVAAFLDQLDDDLERPLVEAVAKASMAYDRLPYRVAAQKLETDVGTILDLVVDINDRCRRTGWPLPLLTETLSEELADGAVRTAPVLVIVRPVAVMIEAASDGDHQPRSPKKSV